MSESLFSASLRYFGSSGPMHGCDMYDMQGKELFVDAREEVV
jgi:hypothetical protein